MLSKRWRGWLIAIGSGAIAWMILLGAIDRSAAQGSIGRSIDRSAISIGPSNLLINPDFENGYTRSVACCNNIAVPIGWNIKWYTDSYIFQGNGLTYTFRQPEVKLDDNTLWPYCDGCAPNVPPRIHSGRYAVDAFASFGGMDVSFYQQVGSIPIGAVVTASAWLHAWTSACNPFPKNLPPQPAISLLDINRNDGTCGDVFWPIETNHMMIGIDPFGGIDPRSANVVWNWSAASPPWWGPYDYYSSTLPVTVTAKAFTITMFLRGITVAPIKFDDMYFDAASLTYCCPPDISFDRDRSWPLTSTVTVTLQSAVTLTQLSAGVIDPNGASLPLTFLGTIGITPSFTSRWTFDPQVAGQHTFSLTAAQLPSVLLQSIEVQHLPYVYVQDQFPPSQITFTLYAPISLTQVTHSVTDPLGVSLPLTFITTTDLNPGYASQWTFAPSIVGLHTLTLSAAEFIQPWSIPILAASDRVFLPLIMRGFDVP